MIEIELLGGFRARWPGTEVQRLPRRVVGDLWTYLLLHHDVPLLVEQAAAVFWPDIPDAQARGNLRRSVYFLTSALPDEDPAAPWLLRDRQTIQWNPAAPFALDLTRFESATRRGRHAADTGDFDQAIALLTQAGDTFRGDLVPENDAEWLRPHRERLRAQNVQGLELLARLQTAAGDLESASATVDRLCSTVPERESGVMLAMWLAATCGHLGRAVQAFDDYRAVLRGRGVTAPGDDLASLATAIREGHDLAAWHPARLLPSTGAAPGGALPSVETHPAGNLPLPADAFIGRESEIADLARLLSLSRLVTLVGMGGAGKSRLAVETARRQATRFRDGVWWVDLTVIADPQLVDRTIGLALGIRLGRDRPPRDTIAQRLRDRELLVILDNCEHLVEACAEAATWLAQAGQRISVLTTSRERLAVMGEVVWPVPALSIPLDETSAPDALLEHDAVQLFVARVREAWPDFSATPERLRAAARIARLVEGIPLAIELAAARVGVLEVAAIADRLERGFSVLGRVSRAHPERHQSLDVAIAWGYALLNEAERIALGRLAVFVGGFGLPAARAVCNDRLDARLPRLEGRFDADELISRLADKSFLSDASNRAQGRRYRLAEVVRRFALARLAESGEKAAVLRAHAEHYVAWAGDVSPHLMQPDADVWMDQIEIENGNLRSVSRWVDDEAEWGLGVQLAASLWRFWHIRGHIGPERAWLVGVLNRVNGGASADSRARAEHGAGILAYDQGDHAAAGKHWELSLEGWQRLENAEMTALMLYNLGLLAMVRGSFRQAEELAQQALAIRLTLDKLDAVALTYGLLADIATRQGNHATAYDRLRQSQAALESVGATDVRLFNVLRGLGRVTQSLGNYRDSERFVMSWLNSSRSSRNKRMTAASLSLLGMLYTETGRFEEAAGHFREAVGILRDIDSPDELARVFHNMGELARVQGNLAVARSYFERSLAMKDDLGDAWNALYSRVALAEIAMDRGDVDKARAGIVDALTAARGFGARSLVAKALRVLARVQIADGDLPAAAATLREGLTEARAMGEPRSVAAALTIAGTLAAARSDHAAALRWSAAADALRAEIGAVATKAEADAWSAIADAVGGAVDGTVVAVGDRLPDRPAAAVTADGRSPGDEVDAALDWL